MNESMRNGKPAERPECNVELESAHLTKLQALVTRARQGDDAVLPQMRELLASTGIWRELGDMARHAQDAWLTAMVGHDHLARESIRTSLAEMRRELDEPGSSRLEKLLIERIVACWLHVQFFEVQTASCDKLPLPQRRFYQQQLESANRQFLTATKQLIVVRNLLPRLDKSRCPEAFLPPPAPASNGERRNGRKHRKTNGQPVNRIMAYVTADHE